jgi:hypothetical protein
MENLSTALKAAIGQNFAASTRIKPTGMLCELIKGRKIFFFRFVNLICSC